MFFFFSVIVHLLWSQSLYFYCLLDNFNVPLVPHIYQLMTFSLQLEYSEVVILKTCRLVTVQTVTLYHQDQAFCLLISGKKFAEEP